jgi:uncharacterized protein YkwD
MRRIPMLIAGLVSSHRHATALTSCDVADHSNDAEELEFLRIINDYRAANGAGPLALSQNLNRAAHWMAWDMGTKGYFGHIDSLGRDPWARIVDCGYPIAGGENLAAGTYRGTAAGAFELFQGSPTHNENMLLARYTQIGIARIFAPGSQYGWYWATTFGTPDDGTGTAAAEPAPPPAPAWSEPNARVARDVFSLHSGANLVSWSGGELSPAELVANAGGSVRMLYRWDEATGTWERFGPGLPWFVQTLESVQPGDALWVVASEPAQLRLAR